MKNLFFLFLGFVTLSSCSKKVAAPPLVGAVEVTEKKATIFTIDATAESIASPIDLGGGIIFQLTKTDLVGAVSYFEDAVTITPTSKIAKNKEHNKGAIVLNAKIEGDDIIHVTSKAGWIISDALYNEGVLYPSKLKMNLDVGQGKSFCMSFVLDRAVTPMRYKPEINANSGQPIMHPSAGYEITDCNGNKAYLSEADTPLQKLYIELRLDDNRTQQKTGGVKLPVDY